MLGNKAVARIYAGILGPLAFLTALARGAMHGQSTEPILWTAWCSLLIFALVGYVIGGLAGLIVDQSVSETVLAELAADKAVESSTMES